MYTKCIENVYHILTNFCIHYVCKVRTTMAAKCCIQNAHRNVCQMWDTFCKQTIYIRQL